MKNDEMREQMTLEESWNRFFAHRDRPTDDEFRKVSEICKEVEVSRFLIRRDGEIIHSEDHRVHIHPGFIVSKQSSRHVLADPTYPSFPFRMNFAKFQVRSNAAKVPPLPKVLCPHQGVWVRPDVQCDYCSEIHRDERNSSTEPDGGSGESDAV